MKKITISLEEKRMIMKAVIEAEKNTSVEFQVHIDKACNEDVIVRASAVLKILHMNKTKTKPWILFYLSLEDHKYAIIGDEGINTLVPDDFWNGVKDLMKCRLNEDNLVGCLSEGINRTGEKLKNFIPKQQNDINELPDEITMGKDLQEVAI